MKYIMYSTPKTVNIDSKVIEDLEQKNIIKRTTNKRRNKYIFRLCLL